MNYVPILKSRAGEFTALERLTDKTKKKILPLIEVTDIPWDFKSNQKAKTLNAHVDKFADKLTKSWGTSYPILIDLPPSLLDGKVSNGDHLLKYLCNEGRAKGLKLVPVTGLGRGATYNTEIKGACATDANGASIRLETSDLANPALKAALDTLLGEIGVKASEVDLILDFKEILPSQENTVLLALQQASSTLPRIKEWRSITFAASSFPKDLSGVGPNQIERIPRTEWKIWKAMNADKARFPTIFGFGDYAISHPVMNEVDPRIIRMSANIRYTLDDTWLVMKGKSVRSTGYGQYSDPLSTQLVKMKEYKGASYSAGDQYIEDCAKKKVNSGNMTTWRFVGVNHHVTLAADQISKM